MRIREAAFRLIPMDSPARHAGSYPRWCRKTQPSFSNAAGAPLKLGFPDLWLINPA
ncbi:MAG TPA: hypothetical protein PKY50_17560 [Candidatus Competibacter sp.]|nr:hypothetical protein [Candidatus Competibacter sp.]